MADFRLGRANSRPERVDFRTKRADFRPDGGGGERRDGRTDGRMSGWMDKLKG